MESGGVTDKWRMFFAGSMVLPGADRGTVRVDGKIRPTLSAQAVHGDWRWSAIAALWLVLLGTGLFATIREHRQFGVYLLALGSFQLALHTFYGSETFLYSVHFAPILVLIAAQSVRLYRPAALVLAGVTTTLCAMYNWTLLHRVLAALSAIQS